MRATPERLLIGGVLAVSVITLGLQAIVLRPRLWPAGAGLALSGETVLGKLAAPRPVAVIRPPDVAAEAGQPVTVVGVVPGGPADAAAILAGDRVLSIATTSGRVSFEDGVPRDPAAALRVWRDLHQLPRDGPLQLEIVSANARGATRTITLDQPPIWTARHSRPGLTGQWLRQHLGPLAQMAAFLGGAAVLLLLGASGSTAALMTLALIATAAANSGPLLGSHHAVPVIGPLVLVFNWLITPLSFPIIGFAVLYFPSRAQVLDRYRWIAAALIAASIPMLIIGIASAAFLLGSDLALPPLAWLATHAWTFEASFALALTANVLIVVEGIRRYRENLDANERRRIQIVVYTGVPAVFAYALKTGLPLLFGLVGQPIQLPWPIEAFLQAIVLLPAFGLPYAVAVRHVFSPRTVLRRSLQYAFATRTLTFLVVLPVIALIASLVQQRDQSLASIVTGRPLFYLFFLAMLGLGLRYRVAAQQWLDRQFFRAEYDAREILVSLAARVPYEADPRDLIAMVVTQIDSALHPECIAVLASNSATVSSPGAAFEPVATLRVDGVRLPADSGVITLLRWSDKPLEVFLDDEQSPVARVPPADRAWLEAMNTALLVPIFAAGSDPRPFAGLIALGAKRSEEPYTQEDRELLRGIAAQMGLALDLSRLRKQAIATVAGAEGTQQFTPTVLLSSAPTAMSIGTVIDGKYRVDGIIGQGGMGAVYRAWDVRLERPVAIKVVRADLLADPDARARFRRESQIVARLQHPSIVTVHDYGTFADGAAFLVMEFVPGEDLRRLIKREGRLDASRTAALIGGIAEGVESAHKAGVFHRDLKPENVLLPESGTGPKVLDFGVAKIASGVMAGDSGMLTAGGTIVGTPAYMSPEQLRGAAVDGRTDVYSLGVMTYEMLTGRLPYGTGSFIEIGLRQAEGEKLIDTRSISVSVAQVLRRALAFEKERRPASPLAFANEFKEAVGNNE